jgi:hypothetical protein
MLNQTNLRFLPALGLSVLNLQYELQIIGLLVPYNQKHNIFRQQGKLKEKKKGTQRSNKTTQIFP